MSERAAALTGIILLAAWLGGVIIVAAIVAPAAFAVLPSRALAGALVGRVLPVLFWSGIVIGLGAAGGAGQASARGVRAAAALMAVACAAAQLVIAPRVARLRERIGGSMEGLDPTDPLRVEFGRLHGASVASLGIAALAGLVALILLTRLVTSRSAA